MSNYIGIDLGGTNLRIGKFDQKFKIVEQLNFETEKEKGMQQIIDKIINGINTIKDSDTKIVGLCVPGQVDPTRGILLKLTNLDLRNINFKKLVNDKCNLELVLNNDANLAGLGESIFGAAKNDKLVYYITWSTGIGGALIINKTIINGKTMCCGEIGNLIIHSNDDFQHSHMNKGGFEGLASGEALKRYARELNYLDVKELIDRYKKGEKKANEIIEYVTDVFARAICNIAHVVEVDCFVLGGGVIIKSGDVLLGMVEQKLNNYLMPMMKDSIVIKKATLLDEAGIFGAAYLASKNA